MSSATAATKPFYKHIKCARPAVRSRRRQIRGLSEIRPCSTDIKQAVQVFSLGCSGLRLGTHGVLASRCSRLLCSNRLKRARAADEALELAKIELSKAKSQLQQLDGAISSKQGSVARLNALAAAASRWIDVNGNAETKWCPDEGDAVVPMPRELGCLSPGFDGAVGPELADGSRHPFGVVIGEKFRRRRAPPGLRSSRLCLKPSESRTVHRYGPAK